MVDASRLSKGRELSQASPARGPNGLLETNSLIERSFV
jgi:hypothetical protein